MDHKISKDMISSGMIPSGEKSQADLGRTQYGSAPSPSSLMDAYKKIYEHHQKDADGKVIEHEEEEVKETYKGLEAAGGHMSLKGNESDSQVMRQALGIKTKTKTNTTTKPTLSQDVDLFDLVKGKLIDEGCDEQEALRIMVNLSEEERENLLQSINELKNWINKKLNQARNNSKIGGNKRVDDTRTNSGDPNVGQKINFGN